MSNVMNSNDVKNKSQPWNSGADGEREEGVESYGKMQLDCGMMITWI